MQLPWRREILAGLLGADLIGFQVTQAASNFSRMARRQSAATGTDSLLAQMSRGQVIMADSTYGQSAFVPANGGAGQPPGVAGAVPVTARVASPTIGQHNAEILAEAGYSTTEIGDLLARGVVFAPAPQTTGGA